MKFSGIINGSSEWLRDDGPQHDIVISSRIRLARNLSAFPFTRGGEEWRRFEGQSGSTLPDDRRYEGRVTRRQALREPRVGPVTNPFR